MTNLGSSMTAGFDIGKKSGRFSALNDNIQKMNEMVRMGELQAQKETGETERTQMSLGSAERRTGSEIKSKEGIAASGRTSEELQTRETIAGRERVSLINSEADIIKALNASGVRAKWQRMGGDLVDEAKDTMVGVLADGTSVIVTLAALTQAMNAGEPLAPLFQKLPGKSGGQQASEFSGKQEKVIAANMKKYNKSREEVVAALKKKGKL